MELLLDVKTVQFLYVQEKTDSLMDELKSKFAPYSIINTLLSEKLDVHETIESTRMYSNLSESIRIFSNLVESTKLFELIPIQRIYLNLFESLDISKKLNEFDKIRIYGIIFA